MAFYVDGVQSELKIIDYNLRECITILEKENRSDKSVESALMYSLSKINRIRGEEDEN